MVDVSSSRLLLILFNYAIFMIDVPDDEGSKQNVIILYLNIKKICLN